MLGFWLAVAAIAGCLGEVRYTVVPIVEGSALQVPEGMGLNEQGVVVGSTDGFGDRTFWIWRNGQRETHLLGGGYRGGPTGIDNRGRVIGWFETGEWYIDVWGDIVYPYHGFIWEDGVLTELGTLGGWTSAATWINDAGVVLGAADDAQDNRLPVMWREGHLRSLQTLATNAQRWKLAIESHYVAADGRIWGAGTYLGEDHVYEIMPQTDGNYSIRSRGRIDAIDPRIHALNKYGQAVGAGWLENGPLGRRFEAFLWHETDMTRLGTLGKADSRSKSINSFAQVVGFYDSASPRAFLWEDGVMYDLNDLIPPDARMTLYRAVAINDSGQIVCDYQDPTTFFGGVCLLNPLRPVSLQIAGLSWTPEGLRFEVRGGGLQPVIVETSPNLRDWGMLVTLTNRSEASVVLDPDSRRSDSNRFYRACFATP
jgi:probable HAF family extracellular repeat protein